MTTRMTSARFVGRSGQLAELEAAYRDAAEGRPSIALVGGESGVGKSRLADELKRHARESGARVLAGPDEPLPGTTAGGAAGLAAAAGAAALAGTGAGAGA